VKPTWLNLGIKDFGIAPPDFTEKLFATPRIPKPLRIEILLLIYKDRAGCFFDKTINLRQFTN
jgi:hypothetical protein